MFKYPFNFLVRTHYRTIVNFLDYSFFFGTKEGLRPKRKREKKLNYTQIPRHASPRNIIINESLKFTGWRLQNNQIPRIQ